MGLFKHSKQPSAPLPVLSLQLSTPQDKVFKPNDTVTGHVSLSTPIPINPQAVDVSLWGHSSVWLRTSHHNTTHDDHRHTDYTHYRDNAPLFAVTSNLLQHAQTLQPGQNYTFPFSFRVPQGTGLNRMGCYKMDTDDRWTAQPHLLPPTFFWGSRPDDPDNASISYGITARLICPGISAGKHNNNQDPLSATTPILFQPLNPHLNAPLSVVRYPKRLTLSSSSLTGQDPASLGLRQKLSDRFSKDTPKLDFEAAIELPDLLTAGAEFRFRTAFAVLEKSANVVAVPAITFRVLKLELLDFTFIRAPCDREANSMMGGYHYKTPENAVNGVYSGQEDTVYREKKTLLNAVPGETTVVLEEVLASEGDEKKTEQARSCQVWFTSRVPGFTPPSFRSFAISRNYRVRAKLQVEIGGKKFEVEAESHVGALGSAA
ncbi:hypothetical protein BU26DRAFT_517629 [Trematosphaeria pertusa]|uniref:Arrestin-like N-terminal domain-containing protein n=1 Tax=Trematosphaeria pertusa TaxID=390896 RepID=A0A6A6IM07_9PLEO|nr:uncharacterized protein BU26DRAFT_517629 [Trematosphaeria pertusa]KAF2250852.1 hypothetical protein BU26DRAFT_517629 [Trematosphaeria pertusa]